jgi:hypothetical protein
MSTLLKKFFILISLLFSSSVSLQAQAAYQDEITHLLVYVKTTKCKYIRNGTYHSGADAAAHIKKKYDYFKDKISTAEDFIKYSATESTMFGNKYYIECAGSAKVPSAVWLQNELDRYRKAQK